ncbi:GntR family transcriptional regulator [Paracoccus sp. (in: a-proteobacteria)]|uniref:GntR family transcriptional regulator n=1 Tax=Paracoccus sp. TaxID=267 RepID=UPI003A8B4591
MNTWQSVRNLVLERIQAREWAPGELIPTEQQLANQLGCARATVNRALRELAESGLIERRRKVGTRVTTTPSRRTTLEIPLMRHEIEATGATYSYRLMGFERGNTNRYAQRALQLRAHHEMLVVKGQYLADDAPHCCETVWLNPSSVPKLQRADLEDQPAHEWLARNVPLTQGRFSILADSATGDCATSLSIMVGTPVLAIERLNWSDKTPVSFARQYYPPRHRLVSED